MDWARNSATTASTARIASAARRPSRRASAYAASAASVRLRRRARVLECGLEIGVRDERDASGELDLRLLRHAVRDRGALLDVRQERRRQRRDQQRAGQRGAERGAEVRHRVLDAADLGALVVRHRRDGDGAELRGERADPEADEQHRHEDDLRPRVGVERAEEDDGSREQRQEPDAYDEARRQVREEARDPDRRDEQRHREREEPHTGLDRRQAERDREEERHDEEEPGLHEVLEEEHRQAAGQLPVAEHRGAHERLLPARLPARLPAEEEPDHEEPAEHEPERRRDARPGRARRPWAGSSPTRPTAARRRRAGRARARRARRRPRRAAAAPRPARPRSAARG